MIEFYYYRNEIESKLKKFEDEITKDDVIKMKEDLSKSLYMSQIEELNKDVENTYKQYHNKASQYKEKLDEEIDNYIRKYPDCKISLNDGIVDYNDLFDEIYCLNKKKSSIENYIEDCERERKKVLEKIEKIMYYIFF